MITLALQYDLSALTAHPDCDYDPARDNEIVGLLIHLCGALHETGAARFYVIAFDDRPWPVSVRRDLSVVLEQLSGVLAALRSSADEFELDFFEQGIERNLLFHRTPSNWLTVEYSSNLDWNPPRSVENIDAADLERQIVELVESFVRAAQVVCPAAAGSPVFREWLNGLHLPDPSAGLRSGSRARGLDLAGSNLAGQDLSRISGDELNLRGADLTGAKLCESTLTGCHLDNARLENSDWSGATLRLCALDGAQGSGASFQGATLEDSTAEAADFSRANLRDAHLTETSFSRAVLRGAALDDAQGDGVEFRGADLRGATLIGVRFEEGDFRGADLRGADLMRGHFHSADFRGALLAGANFTDADCEGASFDVNEGRKTGPQSAADPFATLRDLLTAAPSELRERLQRATSALSQNETPEEWKPFLEPLMKLTQGNPSMDEIIAAVQAAAAHINPKDLQSWLEKNKDAG
jgi:uncharacterized protein YjbI with pentapeptide repeats